MSRGVIRVHLIVRANVLVSAVCTSEIASPIVFRDPVPVINSRFSFADDFTDVTGKILSASFASGTIRVSPCTDSYFRGGGAPEHVVLVR